MFNWLRELLELRSEYSKKCDSCDTLKRQLEIRNIEYEQLLSRLLKEPEPVIDSKPIEISKPRNIPWNLRRQMLENEDRQKAKIMREQQSVQDLEKELGVTDALGSSNEKVQEG